MNTLRNPFLDILNNARNPQNTITSLFDEHNTGQSILNLNDYTNSDNIQGNLEEKNKDKLNLGENPVINQNINNQQINNKKYNLTNENHTNNINNLNKKNSSENNIENNIKDNENNSLLGKKRNQEKLEDENKNKDNNNNNNNSNKNKNKNENPEDVLDFNYNFPFNNIIEENNIHNNIQNNFPVNLRNLHNDDRNDEISDFNNIFPPILGTELEMIIEEFTEHEDDNDSKLNPDSHSHTDSDN